VQAPHLDDAQMASDTVSAEPSKDNRSGLLHRISSIPTPIIFIGSVLIALVLLWSSGSFGDAFDAAKDANLAMLAGAFALYVVGLAILCVRWDVLVRMVKGTSNLPRAAEAFLTSVVINYAAPIGLAVPTRAALTKRALGLDAAETGAAVLWEISVDVIVLGLGSALWLLLSAHEISAPSSNQVLVAALLIGGALLALAGAAFIIRTRTSHWQRIQFTLKRIILFPRNRPKEAALAFLVTLVYWTVQAIVLSFFLRALDGSTSIKLILGLITIPVLVGMLSPVPGGAGIREALMIGVAHVEGADSAIVLLAALIYRIALFAAIPIVYAGVRLWLRAEGKQAIPLEELPENGTMSANAQGNES
jgi:glycosyltransferase 2 family protein